MVPYVNVTSSELTLSILVLENCQTFRREGEMANSLPDSAKLLESYVKYHILGHSLFAYPRSLAGGHIRRLESKFAFR